MMEWELSRHQVCIAGLVSEGRSAVPGSDAVDSVAFPVAGALVSLVRGPEEFQRKVESKRRAEARSAAKTITQFGQTLTRRDGMFWFSDLPEGSYALSAVLPRCGGRLAEAQATTVVGRYPDGRMKIGQVNLILFPTVLGGRVTGTAQGVGLSMAEVRVRGSGEYSLAGSDGAYTLSGFEPGNRTIVVSAYGYESASQSIACTVPSACMIQNFSLNRRRSAYAAPFAEAAVAPMTAAVADPDESKGSSPGPVPGTRTGPSRERKDHKGGQHG